jgi:hypothetical protein
MRLRAAENSIALPFDVCKAARKDVVEGHAKNAAQLTDTRGCQIKRGQLKLEACDILAWLLVVSMLLVPAAIYYSNMEELQASLVELADSSYACAFDSLK